MRAFIIKFVFICIWVGLSFALFKYVMPVLMPFFLGFLFAFLLQPLIRWVTRRAKLPHGPVAVLLMVAFYAVGVSLLVVVGTQFVLALRDLFYQLPDFYFTVLEPALVRIQDSIENLLRTLNPTLPDLISSFGDNLTSSLGTLIQSISQGAIGWAGGFATAVPSFFVKLILTIVVSFFCVVDYNLITSFLSRSLPKKWRALLFQVKEKGVDVILQFGKAYALLISITFVELFIGFSLLRVENAFLLALCVAVVDILPVLGTGTILIPWALAMLVLGNFPLGIALLVLYGVITVVRQMLEPRIVGKQIGLYPLVTLVCMFVGTYLFGFFGLFGLPILATILLQLSREGAFKRFLRPAPAPLSDVKPQ